MQIPHEIEPEGYRDPFRIRFKNGLSTSPKRRTLWEWLKEKTHSQASINAQTFQADYTWSISDKNVTM